MKKSEQYILWFSKINTPNWGISYSCTPAIRTETSFESYQLSELLSTLSNKHPEDLLEEIDNAINGEPFDEYVSFDASTDSVQLVPPNAIFNYNYSINLNELKMLVEEWIAFCNS